MSENIKATHLPNVIYVISMMIAIFLSVGMISATIIWIQGNPFYYGSEDGMVIVGIWVISLAISIFETIVRAKEKKLNKDGDTLA